MGSSSHCGDGAHDDCIETWCDCGCHHALIDEHFDDAAPHDATPVASCQECARGGLAGAVPERGTWEGLEPPLAVPYGDGAAVRPRSLAARR